MGSSILKRIFSTIFNFITIGRLSNLVKDLEILPEGHRDGGIMWKQLDSNIIPLKGIQNRLTKKPNI
jgi:hypothetical protein